MSKEAKVYHDEDILPRTILGIAYDDRRVDRSEAVKATDPTEGLISNDIALPPADWSPKLDNLEEDYKDE